MDSNSERVTEMWRRGNRVRGSAADGDRGRGVLGDSPPSSNALLLRLLRAVNAFVSILARIVFLSMLCAVSEFVFLLSVLRVM